MRRKNQKGKGKIGRSQEKSMSHPINLKSTKNVSQNTLRLPHMKDRYNNERASNKIITYYYDIDATTISQSI